MDLNRWKIFQGLDPSLVSKCKIAKFLRCQNVKAGFLVLQNDEVYFVVKSSVLATGSEVWKVEPLCGKGIIDFFGNRLGFVALSKSGCAYSWDRDSDWSVSMPRQLLFNGDVSAQKVCQISSGIAHNLCLTSDGQVFGWGMNWYLGSSGSGAEFEMDPIKITGVGDNTVQVAAGLDSSYALDSNGRVWSWGTRESTALGYDDIGYTTRTQTPRVIENLYNIKKIAAGSFYALALSEIGELYFWGDFGSGATPTLTPTKITIESTEPITDIGSTTLGPSHYAVFQTKDTVYLWGKWHGREISVPIATEFTSIDEAFANAELPTMLRPITMPVQSHGVEIAWKRAFDDQSTSDIVTVSRAESYGRLAQEKESLLKQLEDLKLEVAHQKSQNLIARHEQNHQVLGVLNTELSCVICSEIIIEAVTIECGHIFCSHCISTWFSQQNNSRSCPTCRTPTFKDPIKNSRLNSTIASFHVLLSEEFQSDRRQLLEVRNKAEQKMTRRPSRMN